MNRDFKCVAFCLQIFSSKFLSLQKNTSLGDYGPRKYFVKIIYQTTVYPWLDPRCIVCIA